MPRSGAWQESALITLTLNYPPTLNTYYRSVPGKGVLISAKGRAYRKHVIAAVSEQLGRFDPLSGQVAIAMHFNPPDRRRRDLDNVDGKAIMDALTHAGVWHDDCQVKRRVSEMGEPTPSGRLEVCVANIKKESQHD